jgi:hypothetical protein
MCVILIGRWELVRATQINYWLYSGAEVVGKA